MKLSKLADRATDAVLWAVSILGTLAATAAALCLIFGYSIVLFSTGSMTPTIRSGDLTVVKSVSASEIRVGDILTVDREDQLPITHRVTRIEEGDSEEKRIITMKGDANRIPDRDSYEVERARVHVFTVPGVAHLYDRVFSNPFVACSVFVIVGALATWGLWPRRSKTDAEADDTAYEIADLFPPVPARVR